MVLQNEDLRRGLELEVSANMILQPRTNSRLWALPAKASSVEGLSINIGVLDEVHAQRGRSLHDTIASGCSKKTDSLFFMVTTAGDDCAGVAYEIHTFLEKLLVGEATDDSFWAALYTTDHDDEWHSPDSWKKANPSWGVSVDPRALEEECRRARQMPGARANFKIKHLCEWIQNGGELSFLDDRAIKKCYDPDLNEADFLGADATDGLDLASRLDMCSAVRVHSRRGTDKKIHHYAFCKSWLPEPQRTTNVAYEQWASRGELVISGDTADHDLIEEHLVAELEKFRVRDISFDPIQSAMLVTHMQKRRANLMVEIAQSAKYLTPGVLELQDAVASGRLHTNSQVLIWALGNLRVRTIGTNMLQPTRPPDRARKIDAAVALIMALRSVALAPLDESKPAPRIFLLDWDKGTLEQPRSVAGGKSRDAWCAAGCPGSFETWCAGK